MSSTRFVGPVPVGRDELLMCRYPVAPRNLGGSPRGRACRVAGVGYLDVFNRLTPECSHPKYPVFGGDLEIVKNHTLGRWVLQCTTNWAPNERATLSRRSTTFSIKKLRLVAPLLEIDRGPALAPIIVTSVI